MTRRLIDGLSRRQFLGRGAVVAAGVAIVSDVRAQPLAKSAVSYARSQGAATCASCDRFHPGPLRGTSGRCSAVVGSIEPGGVCQLWTAAA